jgi:hypothetical protein
MPGPESSFRPASSRLAKREQKTAVRQTIMFLAAAAILMLVFFFIVLPLMARLVTGPVQVNQDETKRPLAPPVISAPVPATNSGTLKLNGFAQPKQEVVLLLNNQEELRQKTDDADGKFSVEVKLETGINTLKAYAVTEDGNESAVSQEYSVEFDGSVPTITLTNVTEGQAFVGKNNQNMSLEGKTEPSAKVYVKGRLSHADDEGVFRATVRLENGQNEIDLRAVDAAGNQTEQKLTVSFQE